MPQPANLELRNQQPHPVKLFIEPWCEEYFLLPGTEMTLEGVGDSKEVRPYFGLEVSQFQLKVWAEGGIHEVRVSQNGEPIEVRHNAELWERFCKEEGVDPSSACKLESIAHLSRSKVTSAASIALERVC